jgi:predicted ATPase
VDVDQPPVVRVAAHQDHELDPGRWPAAIPAVAQVLRHGLDLPKGVTFLVGENGSGKSTIVEAIAAAYGLSPEGGSAQGHHSTRVTESPLGDALTLRRGIGSPRWGFFLRAETMHGYYSWRDDLPKTRTTPPSLHPLSHGESFNALLDEALDNPRYVAGLACLDEPEAALSFSSTLRWLASLENMRSRGTQVICATHSPVLAALPGATILELGEWGIRRSAWEDLELVRLHRGFLQTPERYLRHLFD